jgi:hypothetical protein
MGSGDDRPVCGLGLVDHGNQRGLIGPVPPLLGDGYWPAPQRHMWDTPPLLGDEDQQNGDSQ